VRGYGVQRQIHGRAAVHERLEGLELVGGMHVLAQRVGREAQLLAAGRAAVHLAGNGEVPADGAVLCELQQRAQVPAAVDDAASPALLADHEVPLQSVRLDRGRELVDALRGGRLADVVGGLSRFSPD
jgi:hypothetical protein